MPGMATVKISCRLRERSQTMGLFYIKQIINVNFKSFLSITFSCVTALNMVLIKQKLNSKLKCCVISLHCFSIHFLVHFTDKTCISSRIRRPGLIAKQHLQYCWNQRRFYVVWHTRRPQQVWWKNFITIRLVNSKTDSASTAKQGYSKMITALLVNSKDKLWTGTTQGLSIYDHIHYSSFYRKGFTKVF